MIYDAIIIGGGIAGLSAAVYGARAGKKVLVLEGLMCGGQIINSPKVTNYPGISEISGFDLASSVYEQAVSCGAEVDYSKVIMVVDKKESKVVVTEGKEFECRKLIIATGAKHRELGLPNEKELVGKGISYCATCDGAFFKDKDVAVVGGGNTALMDAIYLSKLCNKVYLIHRRDTFRGEEKTLEEIKNADNIEIITDSVVEKAISDDSLTAVEIKNVKTGNVIRIDVSGMFVAVGMTPNTELFGGLVGLDEFGYIVTDEMLNTNVENIYAVGDCRAKDLRQLVTAAADGAIAGSRI